MFKTAAATVLSATIALTGIGSTPAQAADAGELARLLFGVATVAIIVNELNDRNDRADHHRPVHQGGVIRGDIVGRHDQGRGHASVITPHRPAQARSVPLACQRTIATSDGTRRLFGVPCLQREGVNVARLPQDCRRTVQLPGRQVDAFGSRCLRSAGVTIVN